jgi:MFS family permease
MTTSSSSKHELPWGLRWRSSTFFIIFVVGTAIFTDLFIYSIIVPVLPFVLRDRLGVPEVQLQIYVSVLLGVMAASSFIFSPVAGIIADRVGNRQQPFLAGLLALLFSTVLLAVGDTVGMIALARILQGMSSAVVWVVGLAICLETVGPNRLGTTIGTVRTFHSFHFIHVLTECPDLQLC